MGIRTTPLLIPQIPTDVVMVGSHTRRGELLKRKDDISANDSIFTCADELFDRFSNIAHESSQQYLVGVRTTVESTHTRLREQIPLNYMIRTTTIQISSEKI